MDLQLDEISPAELLRDVLTRLSDPDLAPAGVIVGPATDAEQQAGVISLMDAGMPVTEFYVPTISVRTQVRCLAGTLEAADRIGRGVQRDLNGRTRVLARMASTDKKYLIHFINMGQGPSMHLDSAETWELLMGVEMTIGTDPVER